MIIESIIIHRPLHSQARAGFDVPCQDAARDITRRKENGVTIMSARSFPAARTLIMISFSLESD